MCKSRVIKERPLGGLELAKTSLLAGGCAGSLLEELGSGALTSPVLRLQNPALVVIVKHEKMNQSLGLGAGRISAKSSAFPELVALSN